jgi:hypothetical protein
MTRSLPLGTIGRRRIGPPRPLCWSNLVRSRRTLHRSGAGSRPAAGILVSVLLVGLLPVSPLVAGPEAASGWLQLERDQQTYRDRVEPLDLRETRRLETVERQQRLDLRAEEQKIERAERLDDRMRGIRAPSTSSAVSGADRSSVRRRTVDRQRQRVRSQQQGLPFGRPDR